MQNTARALHGPSFTGHAIVATLIVLPVIAACSESSASETRSAITYAAPTSIGDGTVRTYVVRDSRGVPTSVGVELSESALRVPEGSGRPVHVRHVRLEPRRARARPRLYDPTFRLPFLHGEAGRCHGDLGWARPGRRGITLRPEGLHLARERGVPRDGCALGRRDVRRVQWKDLRPDLHLGLQPRTAPVHRADDHEGVPRVDVLVHDGAQAAGVGAARRALSQAVFDPPRHRRQGLPRHARRPDAESEVAPWTPEAQSTDLPGTVDPHERRRLA